MTSLGAAAVTAWETVFWIVVHGTALAAIAWLVSSTLLRRARPAVVAALWTVVLLKFVVPVGPAMPWSLSSVLDALVAVDEPAAAPVAAPAAAAAPAIRATPALSTGQALALAGAVLWLAGVAIVAARRVREHRALRRRVAAARPAAPEVVAVVAAVARRLGLRRSPAVRVEAGAVPYVIGLGRPVLVLPVTLAADSPELSAVVAHELAHLRRRDAWLRVVQVVAGALFFFVPVVRWVNRRIDAARELACDAWAIERGPLGAHEYARVLVRLVRAHAAPGAALALAAHPRLLGRRVDALVAPRGPRAGVGAPGLVLLGAWALVALGGTSDASARRPLPGDECRFTPELAATILSAYPQADADGDGELTRAEACDFQLEWERTAVAEGVSLLPEESPLGDARLQCPVIGDTSASPSEELTATTTCTQD